MSKSRTHIPVEVINPNAAGIDIGSKEHWVCVPKDRSRDNTRKFGSFTCDLMSIRDWLISCGVTTVMMESTGVYWIPLYQVLEESGIDVCLVNARHAKNVPGRKKTDRLDCQWLQRQHTLGLVGGSFRPDDATCVLRSYMRHRRNLVRKSSKSIQHMQKSLQQMNLLLGNVISDISGVTGMRIISAIIQGERDPVVLSRLKDRRIRSSESEIAKSLEGDWREEHIFSLRQSHDEYVFTQSQIAECDGQIIEELKGWDRKDEKDSTLPEDTQMHKKPRRNDLREDLRPDLFEIIGCDLTQIPGFQRNTLLELVSETGIDMSKWKTEKHFTSWLGLAPNNKVTGGKIIKSSTNRVKGRASHILRLAAQSLTNSKTYMGEWFRRMKYRKGAPKATVAVARKLAIAYYRAIRYGDMYEDKGVEYFHEENKRRSLKSLEKRASAMGLKLVSA